jgi:hypothetical protein
MSALVLVLQLGLGWPAALLHTQALTPATIPPNIHVAANVRPIFQNLLALSSTLLHQTQLIGLAPHVRVFIRLVRPTGALWRAKGTIARHEEGALVAEFEIPVTTELVELISHELEHVIEQMEGVNLAVLATMRGRLAYRDESGRFETARAVAAGQAAAEEVRQARASLPRGRRE